MPITPNELGGDEDTARRVLVLARDIAPCIDTFPDDSEHKKNALAVLKGVLAELPEPGQGRARSLSRNGTSVSFADLESAFDRDARRALRALCGDTAGDASAPRGSFPPAGIVERAWPERAR